MLNIKLSTFMSDINWLKRKNKLLREIILFIIAPAIKKTQAFS
jgi:hypothetical protein